MDPFHTARLRLTITYIGISALFLAIFTLAAIQAERQVFRRIEQALADRQQRPKLTLLLEQRLASFNQNFAQRLLFIDIFLLLGASAASYILSGKTLEPIQKMSAEQQAFAADASHELRTPLTTIGMEIEAFKRSQKTVPVKYQKLLASIQEETSRLKSITEGLLALVRPESDRAKWQAVDLTMIAQVIATRLKPLATKKHLRLTPQSHPESVSQTKDPHKLRPVFVRGNPDQLHQIALILIDNAIKYTPEQGSITISTSTQRSQAQLTVTDTGLGIDPSDLPHIFDRFYRSSTTGKFPRGTGLGLPIAQKLARLHHGRITVQSQVGNGSTFSLVVPTV